MRLCLRGLGNRLLDELIEKRMANAVAEFRLQGRANLLLGL
jgi:hypothetical protein